MQQKDIRLTPFNDDEVSAALKELFAMPPFIKGMKQFLPPDLSAQLIDTYPTINTVFGVQEKLIYPVLQFIAHQSIKQLTASGIDNIDPQKGYLFISNHRDIVLDSAYLNMMLFEEGIPTSQIAIGNNLIIHRMSELLFRLNKSFVVMRKGAPRELYHHSIKLSNYIHQTIKEHGSSIWIAQREGRAKDGNDCTQLGILKMLTLAKGELSLRSFFKQLNIIPVSISYEFDPTDVVKTKSYIAKMDDPNYKKTFQEDVQHILLGLKGNKGSVHIHFGQAINEQLDNLEETDSDKQQLEKIAHIIDQSIHQSYQLNPINYIAHDLLTNSNSFAANYSPTSFQAIAKEFVNKQKQFAPTKQEDAQNYLLGIYANPLKNALVAKDFIS